MLPTFKFFLVSNHFHNSEVDSNVYIKFEGKKLIIIVVYVDDSTLLSNNVDLMEDTKKFLSKEFEMSDLKSLHFCMGMEILYDKEHGILSINQQRYIKEKIFQRYNMWSYNSTITPMEGRLKLSKKDSP